MNFHLVNIGELAVSANPQDILTVYGLGSCVVICLYDPKQKVGGMLHALLPNSARFKKGSGNPAKFVDKGLAALVKALVELKANPKRFEAYLCGGAQMLPALQTRDVFNIGELNIQAARLALQTMGLRPRAEAVGGQVGRTVKLYLATGQVSVKALGQSEQFLVKENNMSTVMIVDDSQFIRARIAKLLVEQGYRVVEASDGEKAVQAYDQVKPDAVLMDIAMSQKNGLTALSEILSFDPEARIIMLTALGQQAIILRALQAGAKDFLVKPYNPDKLLKTLQKVLG